MKDYGFSFNASYINLPNRFFSINSPNMHPNPQVYLLNHTLAHTLGLKLPKYPNITHAKLLSGNLSPAQSTAFSQAYAGHQFGHFTMLGDGRAHILGEHITPTGARYDIQCKGSGKTPYSHSGDGKAALGPMLREYIISEAMHYLNIPTTRSLAVITTGESILRERTVPGAVLTRVAQSHIRVGTFEYAAALQDISSLKALLHYTIDRHYPDIAQANNPALTLLERCMAKQLNLIVEWMRVGFIHGVMNTDNMSIAGETIDYGPCAFMDTYKPSTVFSSIDHMGRYAYAEQPKIAQWNLAVFARTLLPLIHCNSQTALDLARDIIDQFPERYQTAWHQMMCRKIGLIGSQHNDAALVTDLLDWMYTHTLDYTNTFRDLSQPELPKKKVYQQRQFQSWHTKWQTRLEKNPKPLVHAYALMQQNNPAIIPRNHIVEAALQAAHQGKDHLVHALLDALKDPYKESESAAQYQQPPKPNEVIHYTFCGT